MYTYVQTILSYFHSKLKVYKWTGNFGQTVSLPVGVPNILLLSEWLSKQCIWIQHVIYGHLTVN